MHVNSNRLDREPTSFDLAPAVSNWDYIMPGGITTESFAQALERWLWHENPHIVKEVAAAATQNDHTGVAVLLARDSAGAAAGFRYKEIDSLSLLADHEAIDGVYFFDSERGESRAYEAMAKNRRMGIGGPGRAQDDDMPYSMEESPSPHQAEPGGSDDFFEDSASRMN